MAICSFFLQGRCRYGEKCWNEHPRGGSSRYQSQNRYQEPPGNAKGTWGSSSQRYVQPSSFSRSTTWVNRDNEKPSSGSHSGFDNRNVKFTAATGFPSSQNRFAALSSQDNSRDAQTDKGNIIDDITNDMEIWESSGQWMFSVYSMLREKKNISGFADFSPEELRLEYYACQAEGNPLKYINAVQQLGSKWKQRILELKNLNPSSKMALFNELSSPSSDMTSGYKGQQKPAFGSSSFPTNNTAPTAATFSFKADAANAAKAGATNSLAGSNVPAFGNKPTSAPSFGSGGAATAASFSFAPSSSSNFGATTSTSGFGNASNTASFQGTANSAAAPAFGVASSSTAATGFGGGFSTTGAMNTGVRDLFSAGTVGPGPVTSLFVQTTGPLHATASSTSLDGQSFRPSALNTTNSLFTPQNELSAEELAQFKAQRFTLGKIPLKPPPADLLNVS